MTYDEALAARVREMMAGVEGVRERRMFGGLAFLIGGHMSVAASGQGGLMVRVAPEQTDDLLAEEHVEPMVMRGRALDGWIRVAAGGLGEPAALRRWVDLGVAYASSLPPKA